MWLILFEGYVLDATNAIDRRPTLTPQGVEPMNTFEGAMTGTSGRALVIASCVPIPGHQLQPLPGFQTYTGRFFWNWLGTLAGDEQPIDRRIGSIPIAPIDGDKWLHPNGLLVRILQGHVDVVFARVRVFVGLNDNRLEGRFRGGSRIPCRSKRGSQGEGTRK